MDRTETSPDTFIESQPETLRSDLERLDAVLSKAMSGHARVMWEGRFWGGTDQHIIGYGEFSYPRSDREKVEWFIVGLAAQKNHMSIYVNAADEDGYLVKKHAARLGKVEVGSAVIRFRSADDLDLEVLEEVVSLAREQLT